MNRVYHRRWIRFAKGGKMKYIGHLDLLKIFQSAIRRAKLPIAYSMGFNPHQRISFAQPLPLGIDSVCEYMELLLDEDTDNLKADLDPQLPEGLRILSVYNIQEKVPKPAAAVRAADYRVVLPNVTKEHVQGLKDAAEIIITKRTKGGEKEVDIRKDVFALEYDPIGAVTMRLTATLNPMFAAQKIIETQPHQIAIVRQELYGEKNQQFVPLHEIAL